MLDMREKSSVGLPRSRKVVLSALLIALGVLLSFFPGSIPIGPTRVFPFQHMINAVAGVVIGPGYAAFIAFSIGILRISAGTGTIFALTGGIPGAIVVGLVYKYLLRRDTASFSEPAGTALGALLSALLISPLLAYPPLPPFMGIDLQWLLYVVFFWMSSIPGAILGFALIKMLRRSHLITEGNNQRSSARSQRQKSLEQNDN
jgi:energy coupling factor transporter S component ThiW